MAVYLSRRFCNVSRVLQIRALSNQVRLIVNRNSLLDTTTKCFLKKDIKRISTISRVLYNKDSLNDNIHELPINEEEFRLIYEGPLSRKIRWLKFFSLSTASLSIMCGPALIFMGRASVSIFAKLFLASTIVTMGVTTTLLLHWLTRVYVYRMYFHPQTRTFAAETSSLIGGVKRHLFSVEDVTLPEIEAAFSTFEARGNKYFIHMELKEAEQILKYVREYNLETL